MVEKQDHYVETFMGTTYEVGNPRTIGELKSVLEGILSDLPNDSALEILQVDLRDGKIDYTLKEGIVQ